MKKIHQLLLEDLSDSNDEISQPRSQNNNEMILCYNVEEDYNMEASEQIEERNDDSQTEQSDTDTCTDEEDSQEFYASIWKKGNIIESFPWKKNSIFQPKENCKIEFTDQASGCQG